MSTETTKWECDRCKVPPEDCECPGGPIIAVGTSTWNWIQKLLRATNA